MGLVVQSTISTNLGLPVNLLFWFHLFWLKSWVQIWQRKTFVCTQNQLKKIPIFLSSMIGKLSTNFWLIVD